MIAKSLFFTLLLAGWLIGHIHWYDHQRGVGYIKYQQQMVFFHFTAVSSKQRKLIKAKRKVSFLRTRNTAKRVKIH